MTGTFSHTSDILILYVINEDRNYRLLPLLLTLLRAIVYSHPQEYFAVSSHCEDPRLLRMEFYVLDPVQTLCRVSFQHFQGQNHCVTQRLVVNLEVEDMHRPVVGGRSHERVLVVEVGRGDGLIMVLHGLVALGTQIQIVTEQLS